MSSYRSVIIGCGGRAAMHALAYKYVDRGQVVACCDLVTERREKFAQQFGVKPYADAEKMIRQEKPDLVHIVTPPTVRVEVMRLVNDLEVPVCLVEKPIAYQVRDWKALCALEAESQTRFGVSAQFRYHPTMLRCREALRSGKLGRILFLDGSAGSTICDQGVHNIDWGMSLNEDAAPVRVFGTVSGNKEMAGRHPSPDTTTAQLLFANGVRMLWNLGYTAPRVLDDPAVWKHGRIAAYAERGRTLYEEFARWEIVSPDGSEQGRVADMQEWTEGNHHAQANLTNAMFDWLEDENKPVETCLKRSLTQWNAILGLYASAVYRRPIDLPFDPPDDLWEKLGETLAASH